jgi:hypothetical protein
MRRTFARIGLCSLAVLLCGLTGSAQQTSGVFRWIDFHSAGDQNIVAWVSRSLEVTKWTSIREIGVEYDAALVLTEERTNPQSAPGSGAFTVWSASLTSHVLAPLVTGANLRWFDPVRFADDASDEWPVLYDNCHDCQPNTFFTAFYYDVRSHTWSARWINGGHGAPVWNATHPAGTNWTQAFALLSNGEGHSTLYAWNHFDYAKPRPAEDYITRYDLDPFNHVERSAVTTAPTPPTPSVERQLAEYELQICRAETAPPGLARGQDSELCQNLLKARAPRQPVTTPPANNRGQSAPPRTRR